jgi:hypothetical protein
MDGLFTVWIWEKKRIVGFPASSGIAFALRQARKYLNIKMNKKGIPPWVFPGQFLIDKPLFIAL